MKALNFLLLLLFILVACSKEEFKQEPEPCMAVTYIFNTGDTVIHWHKVCNAELKYYQSLPQSEIYCGDGRTISLVIGQDKCSLSK